MAEQTDTCSIHKTHNPSVALSLEHFRLPEMFMARLRDRGIAVPPKHRNDYIWVCPTGKANIEQYAMYLLGEIDPLPVRVGTETKVLAQEAVTLYQGLLTGARTTRSVR